MPDNGSGTFAPPSTGFPFIPDTLADATVMDDVILDISNALSNRIAKNGETTLTNDIPFNGFKATGMGAGTARNDAATIANLQNQTGIFATSVGGTANAITLIVSPSITAYQVGQRFSFIANARNTGAVTVSVSGLPAQALNWMAALPIESGDIPAGGMVNIAYDGTQFLVVSSSGHTVADLGGAGNVKKYGAKGDGVTDDSAAFQACCDEHLAVYIPETTASYLLTNTVTLRSFARVFGDGYTCAVKWTGGDLPIFAHPNYADVNAAGSEWVTLDNFRVDDHAASRPSNWMIHLSNAKNILISRMRIEGVSGGTNTDLYGIFVGFQPGTTYSGDAWLNYILDTRLSSAKVWMNSGDNFVRGNSLYGYTRDYALRAGGTLVIEGNEIGGGEIQGAIYLDNSDHAKVIGAVKIIGNHFDGNDIQTSGAGVYSVAAQQIRQAVIMGNTAFSQNAEFVHLAQAHSCVIAQNIMRNMDADDTGEPDIYVSGWGNVIGPNTHIRNTTAPKAGVRVNLGLPVHVVQSGSTELNIVIPGTVTDDSHDYLSTSFVAYDAHGDTRSVQLFDDFMGVTLNANLWRTAVGSDGNCVAATVGDIGLSAVQMTFGNDAGGTMALNGSQLSSGLQWQPVSGTAGGLAFEALLKLNTITDVAIFVGLTDQYSALEMPFTLEAGDILTSNATNAAGFLFDTAADTDLVWLVGVKADVDATKQNSGVTFIANTNILLRMEFTTDGMATFFINGVPTGTLMSNSLSASLKYTPVVAGFSRINATRIATVDYIKVEHSRY